MIEPSALRATDAALASEVARRHYLGSERKVDIAASMGISRFKVARLLEAARSSGIVRIEIVDRGGVDGELSARLRTAYGLRRCIVVDCSDDAPRLREHVGSAGADVLHEVVGPQDVLGLPWARTVSALVEALPELPPVPVVQLSGSMVIPGERSPVDMVRAAAGLAGGEAHLYYAPFILDDAASAAAMRRQPAVAQAMAEVERVTVAVVSIGAWEPGHSTIHDAVDERDRAEVAAAGAVGEALGVFVDREGRAVHPSLVDRMVTIGDEELRRVPETVALATGAAKAGAVRAFLTGGWVDTLVTDRSLATVLARSAGS
ncbi:transcriptional regulator [Phycicoccus endophyticus]|uniref:Transcriptional regulator n=1 Tax=Phycicoccus endophyticus TaxID=1690220 RepID=A0A7G9R0D8_9MICO|nr:sugar-binding domain-containing protein [Phycicoccus endophyticus]NHI20124.1 transcriptional regulator [Phycicoccus endophyticus]QNN49063.1 transcriptional regulator [Phycicoccus endophyticus]GGL38186.1 transcriptional regulator [Phycicoccus endophyticus]